MKDQAYTPAQASAIADLPLKAIHKLIDSRLIHPRWLRIGKATYRVLSQEQLIYLRLEAEGVRLLPLVQRREVAKAVEAGADVVKVSKSSALIVQVKPARQKVRQGLLRLRKAEQMIVSDPEIMRGAPVYRGTRIPVGLVADMLRQGATVDEIVSGYPALDREKVELAPLYVNAFPRRGRPVQRPWANGKPVRVSRHALSEAAK